jgi:excisionase family DNA binding protein
MTLENYPDVLSVNDVQSVLQIGRTMVYKLINNGAIKHLRIGKTIKVPKCFLVDYIISSCYHGNVAVTPLSY